MLVTTDTIHLARDVRREIVRLGGVNPAVYASSDSPPGYVKVFLGGSYLLHAPTVLAEWADRPDRDWQGSEIELEAIAEDRDRVWDEEPFPAKILYPIRLPDDEGCTLDPWAWVVQSSAADGSTVYGWTLSRRYRTPDDFRRYPRGIRFSTPGDAEEDAWEHGWKD